MDLPFTEALPELQVAIDAAQEAGKRILDIYQKPIDPDLKLEQNPQTEADRKSNQILINKLSAYPILSEEKKDDLSRLNSERVWIIDPLDGTKDFINKIGEFTVMIALVEKHKPILGIILWPIKNIFYIAQKDKGAYMFDGEWKKITVSQTSDFSECRIVHSRHHLNPEEGVFFDNLRTKENVKMGSSLKAMKISEGEAEIYLTRSSKIKHWDTCASYCILTEAGGKMTDIEGNELVYNIENVNHLKGVLATNGVVHQQVLQKYKEFLAGKGQKI